jgi:hypothetical protein
MKYFVVIFFSLMLAGRMWAEIVYLHPLPFSAYHSTATTVIVRFENSSALTDPNDVQFTLKGRIQKSIQGKNILSSDGETFIFKPSKLLAPGDTISLTIKVPKLNIDYSSYFFVSTKTNGLQAAYEETQENDVTSVSNPVRLVNGVSLPKDFPEINVRQNGETADGFIFITTYDLAVNYAMILRNDGTPYYYRRRLGKSRLWDYTVQGDRITLIEGETARIFDDTFEQVAWQKAGHGYKTDYHEFRLTPEGHRLLICEDIEVIDMSQLIELGRPNARVVGNHVQEIDADGNVILEWRSWDNYNILDSHLDDFTGSLLHYAHINAVDIDYDGNLLISARTMDEITKVDRRTGKVIWRLGGKNNYFTFVNDPDMFFYQHDIRAVPGKPNFYTLFDNGNYHHPQYSRAVEYYLDVDTYIATKAWEYRQTPDYYSHWMGSVQRLPNGNTGICWALKSLPDYTEVDAYGNIVYELEFKPSTTVYRAHRFPWQGRARAPYLLLEEGTEAITLIYNHFGAENIAYYNIYADTLENPITLADTSRHTFINLSDLVNEKTYYFRVTSVDNNGVESDFSDQVSALVQIIKPGENQIRNGDFEQDTDNWVLSTINEDMAMFDTDNNGHLNIQILESNGFANDVRVSQRRILLAYGRTYKLEFDAYANSNRPLDVRVMDDKGNVDYSELGLTLLTMRLKHYSFEFDMQDETDKYSRLFFNVGDMVGDVYLDNVYLSQVTDTKVADHQIIHPQNFELFPAYPNPFNARTSIRYSLGAMADVKLAFYDVLGREVFTEDFGSQQAGDHTFQFDAQELSSGVYFCQIRVENFDGAVNFSDRIKVMLLK